MTITYTSRATIRRRLRRRIVLIAGAAALGVMLIAGAVVVVPRLLPPGPRPLFQMPVGCGQTWQLGTYPGHGTYDIDFFPLQGEQWGQPVLASYAGTVTVSGINGTLGSRTPKNPRGQRGRGGGYWVKIDHAGRWETQYLHLLEPPMVREGQEVEQGQQIGRVGSTGDSGAPHLHYEQRRARVKVESWFDGKPSGITTDRKEFTLRLTSNNCADDAGQDSARTRLGLGWLSGSWPPRLPLPSRPRAWRGSPGWRHSPRSSLPRPACR